MKYSQEIEIHLPRTQVVALFNNTENLKKWQPGLIAFEPIEGTPGEVGSTSHIKYSMGEGKGAIDMVETVTEKNLPHSMSFTYETKDGNWWNELKNEFEDLGSTTKWIMHNESRPGGIMRYLAPLMQSKFKQQTATFMQDFKEFAENA